MNEKSVDQLTWKDFEEYPVWEPVDDFEDDERRVVPCMNFDSLDLEKIYLLAAQYRLADGSEFNGYIRMSWGEVRMLALTLANNTFVYFAIGVEDPTSELRRRLSNELSKNVDDVFPIKFQTLMEARLTKEIF